jgi:phenylacetate-CoA ligase
MLTTPEWIAESAQLSRLAEVLPGWLERVPLYRQLPAGPAAKFSPALDPLARLRQLPFITKQDLRRGFPGNFLGENADAQSVIDENLIEVEQTSGTSEERTSLLLPRGWWDAQEEKALRQNRFVGSLLDEFPAARRVTLNSPVCAGDICYSSVPSRSERIVRNSLHVSLSRHPFLWTDADWKRIADEASDWQPLFLDLDPVYGALFAQYCERYGVRFPSLRFIICSYEFVSAVHRRILERVFGVPIFNLYGSTETGHLLMENEHGEMIPSLETALLEVVEPDANGAGDLIVTTLTNDYMPLIRYRIGDLVERRELPYHTTYAVHGREHDAFQLADGTRATTLQVDECFTGLNGFTHYQLLQQGAESWRLHFVADGSGPAARELAELRMRLAQELKLAATGALEIDPVEMLLAETSGKFLLGYPLSSAECGVRSAEF